MNKKNAFALVPVFALSFLGAGNASAHGFFGGWAPTDPVAFVQMQQTRFEKQAGMLGISTDEIKDAWADGKNLADLATTKGITKEQLKSRMDAAHQKAMEERTQALVDNGVITKKQAERHLQFMSKNKGVRMHGKELFEKRLP